VTPGGESPPPGPHGPAPDARRARALKTLGLLAVALLALALRWHPPRDEVLYPDAAVYMRQAEGYLHGRPSIAPPWLGLPAGGPLYPALTALAAPLAGDVERAGVWVSRAAGVGLAVAAAALAWALGGPLAGLAAGALAAVEPRLVHFAETDLTESLFMALLVAALALARRLGAAGVKPWGEAGLGALLGAVALTRAVGLAFLPAVAVLAAAAARLGPAPLAWRSALARGARIAAGGLVVVGLYQGLAWSNGWTTAFDTHAPAFLKARQAQSAPADAPAAPALETDFGTTGARAVETAGRGLRTAARALAAQVRVFGGMLPGPVWLLALVGLGARLARRRAGAPGADLVLLGAVAAYLAALALFGTSLGRYLVAVFPVAFVYAGCGLGAVAAGLVALFGRWVPRPAPRPGTQLPWLAPGVAVALAAALGVAAVERVRTVFTVPERQFAPARALAREVAEGFDLKAPLAVYADHAFLPYYLGGYWRGPAPAPERVPALGDGSRAVVLDTAHTGGWPADWVAPALERRAPDGFALAVQRYYPASGQLVSVYVDAPPKAPAPAPDPAALPELLAAGRFSEAARALAAAPDARAARRARGVMEMVAGQFFPERLAVARRLLAPRPGDAPAPTPPGGPARWRWSRAPGEVRVGLDDASTAWNRAALAVAVGDDAAAAREIPALARAFGPDPRVQYLAGLALTGLGRPLDALHPLAAARQALPDDLGVAVAWANAMAMSGGFGQAVPVYREVLAKDPGNAGVWFNLIRTQLLAGDPAGADASLAAATRLPLTPPQREHLEALARERARRAAHP